MLAYINENYADNVILSDEQDLLLDSGGGVLKALSHTDATEFFVINADCIWHNPKSNALLQLYDTYNKGKFSVCKLLVRPRNAVGFDGKPIYNLDNTHHIHQEGDLNFEYTGIQILKRNLFDNYMIKPFSIREIWQKEFDNNNIGGTEFIGKWLHIGTPLAVMEAEDYLKQMI